MLRLLLFLGLGGAILVQSANTAGPSRFYIVSVFYYQEANYYRVVDVQPDGPDSIVRYARIAPRNPQCFREIVQAAEARIRDTTPAQLILKSNLCAVTPHSLKSVIKRHAKPNLAEESTTFGIVAECGSRTLSFALPSIERVNVKRMQKAFPEMVHVWDLASDVTERAFGANDIFHDRTEEDDLALQREGEKQVPVLLSGRYDKGFALAANESLPGWEPRSLQFILGDYVGPFSFSQAKEIPRLLNADQYNFTHFVDPAYPPLAKQARIQGRVELQLQVDAVTGEVGAVTIVSGHPLFHDSAIAAAKQWRFPPHSITNATVRATLEFEIRCPMPARYDRSL